MKFLIVVALVASAAWALPTTEDVTGPGQEIYRLMDGITVVKSNVLDNSARADDDSVTGKIQRFLSTHTLKIDLKGSDVVDSVQSVGRAFNEVSDSLMGDSEIAEETARGKVKKAGKLLGPLLMGILLKAALLAPLALGAIALIAGKALIVGKIALLLSAVIGLKKLLSGQGKTVTYEVVSHPHYSHSSAGHDSYSAGSSPSYVGSAAGSSTSGGWGRSSNTDAQNLAYRAQKP